MVGYITYQILVAWEQLSLGLLFVGSRPQEMLPFCCLEPWHVNQDSVSRSQEGTLVLEHAFLLGHGSSLCGFRAEITLECQEARGVTMFFLCCRHSSQLSKQLA